MEAYLVLGILVLIIVFILYLAFDFFTIKGGANQFWDKWVNKTLWLWLPFYALQRLVREVFLGEGKK